MTKNLETIVFGGGCFWCTEAIFKRLKGVVNVTSGYSGGEMANPSYEIVSGGKTGYAESAKVEFDPTIVSIDKLLEVFFATHDPTTPNRQGNDLGTQYRSIIFYTTDEQKNKALAFLKPGYITEILPLVKFYSAEEYHQNFYEKQPNYPYCDIVIVPKLHKLLEKFSDDIKEEYKN